MKKALFIIITTFIGITSCKKTVTQPKSGIFRGTFSKIGLNGGGEFTGDCTIALDEKNNTYRLNVDSTSNVPYKCYGTYIIIDGTKMKFHSSTGLATGGDQYMLLDSVYTYSFDDTRFDLSKQIDTIKYEYHFVRY